jgi:hypothetical protein
MRVEQPIHDDGHYLSALAWVDLWRVKAFNHTLAVSHGPLPRKRRGAGPLLLLWGSNESA